MSSGKAHWYNCDKCQDGPCGVCEGKMTAERDEGEERLKKEREEEERLKKEREEEERLKKEEREKKGRKRKREASSSKDNSKSNQKKMQAALLLVPPQHRGSVLKKKKTKRVKRTKKPRKSKSRRKRRRTGARKTKMEGRSRSPSPVIGESQMREVFYAFFDNISMYGRSAGDSGKRVEIQADKLWPLFIDKLEKGEKGKINDCLQKCFQ